MKYHLFKQHWIWSPSSLSLQEPLNRKVIEEGVYSKSLKVEVYPWHLKICENSKPEEQISKMFSRSDTVGKLAFLLPKIVELILYKAF